MVVVDEFIQSGSPEIWELPSQRFLNADEVADLYLARSEASAEAAQTLEANRQLLIDGHFESVPIPVDALGTANAVVTARTTFGESSPEYNDAKDALLLDSSRLLAEAFRKNTWEYFAKVKQERDPNTSEYISHGFLLSDIVRSGLSPVAEPEEQARRSNEFVEEATYRAIGQLGLSEAVSVQTISECPDYAVAGFKLDPKASHGGYVPGITKLMVRNVRFDTFGNRTEEQIGLPGTYITHEVVRAVLEDINLVSTDQDLSKTDVHATQIIDRQAASAVDFVKRLDQKASELSGQLIFMGEAIEDPRAINYAGVEDQAESRRQILNQKTHELTDYLIELASNKTDRWAADALVSRYVKNVLFEAAKSDPGQAEIFFDHNTTKGISEFKYLMDNGYVEQAESLLATVRRDAPEPAFCGAGSCGLEAVRPGSLGSALAKASGLKGNLLRDKVRSCPNLSCSAKSIFYDESGKKACVSCGYNNVKGLDSEGKGFSLLAALI